LGGPKVPFVVEDDGLRCPAVGKVVQAVIPALVASGADEMRITHLSCGVKAVRIDSTLIESFAAEWIAQLSPLGTTIVAIKVDNRLADAVVVVEAHGVVRPFFAGSAG
jgi:hypothetical protein